ncbi:MAG: hypothetical protein AAF514_09055 [Verrucomicrobiota bacterium]
MNFGVIQGLVLRYLFLYTRNWVRLVELLFWPLMDLLVWGYLTVYLKGQHVRRFSGDDLVAHRSAHSLGRSLSGSAGRGHLLS